MASLPDQSKPLVRVLTVGELEENCYLYACPETREAVIIDPGAEPERILATIQELHLIPRYILNTHGHFDHIGAIDAVSEVYPVPLAIHPDDLFMYTDPRMALMAGRPAPLVRRKPDILLREGKTLSFGSLKLEVLHTPGHSPGSVSLLSPSHCLFAGDTLFHRGIGRTDLPGGSYEKIFNSIIETLYTLDEELVVFPGHGESTTILEEKTENPFVNLL